MKSKNSKKKIYTHGTKEMGTKLNAIKKKNRKKYQHTQKKKAFHSGVCLLISLTFHSTQKFI
jgi:hypothetical protein